MNEVQRQSRLGLIKEGFIQQGRHSTSLHKDKTFTTDAFKYTKDARQDALTQDLMRAIIMRQWFLEDSFMRN